MAKKKKPAANPARGFATTSVPSKPKVDQAAEPNVKVPKEVAAVLAQPAQASSNSEPSAAAVSQTPEELEAQLERDELQLLIEKHAAKARRESRRQVLKFQTDQRVLRPQAQSMTVHDWLPEDVLNKIIALALAESNDSNQRQGQQSFRKVLSEEDALAKLWTLDLTLRDMGFEQDHIQDVLQWLCANAANVDATVGGTWGFQEALEWLALNQSEGPSFSYDGPKPKPLPTEALPPSRPGTPVSTTGGDVKHINQETSSVPPPKIPSTRATPAVESQDDANISDLDSDIEPDQIVPTYLKIKGRLFELDAEAVNVKPRKSAKKGRNPMNATESPAVRKLRSQLQQLESDALFDQDEADQRWPALRNEIAQAKGAEKMTKSEKSAPTPEQQTRQPPAEKEESSPKPQAVDALSDDEDSGMLGEMFTAVSDQPAAEPASGDQASDNITLRDFGKQTGTAPRRVLEEAVRARDPAARLTYKLISPTTYICRHSLTVTWSKDQDIEYDTDINGVTCHISRLQATFIASTVATVSVEQSESYISTAALFSIFAPSAKEEKIYMRLPPSWRDLYKDYLEHRKDRLDTIDRGTIQRFRTLINNQIEDDESDGVVLTSRFKMRNQAAASSSNPNSGRNTPVLTVNESLQEFWHWKSTTPSYQRMLVGRMNLPVYEYRANILSVIDKNQVTIICGETGCGKSTQIPSFILEHELSQGKACKIFCTEPRRISAISLAQRVSEELGENPHDLGSVRSVVGYAIRLESKTSAQTKLVFATVGVVLRMLESSGRLDEVTHLIIDEVHERSIDTDFLLIILRSLMLLRPELKVVLMSATVDADRFSKYLNDAPVVNVPGRTFPVKVNYLEDAIEMTHYSATGEKANDTDTSGDEEEPKKDKSGIPSKLPGYSATTKEVLSTYDEYGIDYDLILRLIESVAFDANMSAFSHAFLVFLPGIAEIRQLNDMILGHPSFERDWLVYPLHSTISSEDQQAAFNIPPPGVRKIVISTNIAETGVTIPDITCVIDTGKHKEMRFDERRQLSRLTQSFISRANAKQRRGRAGRVQEGLCFHLFTKYRHDNLMMDQQTPEMLRLSLQDLVMRTKICKLGDIEKTLAEALDPPSSRNIRRAIDALIEVDALTPGEELTPLGRQIAKLPLDAHLGKLVLLSSTFGCVDVAITIAAILSSKSPFLTPFHQKQRADAARLAFKKGDSDLLTAYNAYCSWKNVCITAPRSEMPFCNRNFLSAPNLSNIEDLKAQLLSSLVEAGFIPLSPDERRALSRYRSTTRHRTFVTVPPQFDIHSENDILVNSVIATAFYPKILIKEGKGWRNIANNQTVSLAPTSVNKTTSINISPAKFLSYYHIMQSAGRNYNAHSTSIVHPLPMCLMVGADVQFLLHAGIVSLPGNVLRFSVKSLRAVVALKVLRRRVKEILALGWKNPGRKMGGREEEWIGIFKGVFEGRWRKEEKVRERAGAKGK